jgi:hypothetical protein
MLNELSLTAEGMPSAASLTLILQFADTVFGTIQL